MSSDPAIEVDGLGKCYEIYHHPRDRLLQMLVGGRKRYYREFWALRDVSFTVAKGETVGIVGRNGAGKSTLLQIICGTLNPTGGTVRTSGRVAAMLELGSGFNPEFSGRENVYLNGAVLGFTTYSSGMVVRLAFAVNTQVMPEVLIVDEALAVGDARFQAKCFERLRALKAAGTAILLVSHATEQIVTHCDRAILLEGGQPLMDGEPRAVVNRYLDLLFGRERVAQEPEVAADANPAPEPEAAAEPSAPGLSVVEDRYAARSGYNPGEYRWGDGAATLTDFAITTTGGAEGAAVNFGAPVKLYVALRFNARVVNPILGFAVKTREGVTIYNTNTEFQPLAGFESTGEPGTSCMASLGFRCALHPGDYFLSVGLASRQLDGEVIPHDRRYDSIHLQVLSMGTATFFGLVDLNVRLDRSQCSQEPAEQQS